LAGVALSRAFPQTQGICFLPRSPDLHDFSLMFLMLYSPLDTALLLVLLQPSGDGYFWLCSSRSSFRGTLCIRIKPTVIGEKFKNKMYLKSTICLLTYEDINVAT